MPAPVGAVVTITYDAGEGAPQANDFLQTKSGRLYCVLAARKMASKHPNRYRLTLLVVDAIPRDVSPSASLWPLQFYARNKR